MTDLLTIFCGSFVGGAIGFVVVLAINSWR